MKVMNWFLKKYGRINSMNDNIIKFSNELNNLIKENENLKSELEHVTEWFKLAISLNGELDFRSVQNADKNQIEKFFNDTIIVFGSKIRLFWKERIGMMYDEVTVDEIEKIFNSKVNINNKNL